MSFDPTNSGDITSYEYALIEDAKANPRIGLGMPVWVYHHDEPYKYLGEGIVVHMHWSRFYEQYVVDVRGSDCVFPCVLAGCLEPIRRSRGMWIEEVISND